MKTAIVMFVLAMIQLSTITMNGQPPPDFTHKLKIKIKIAKEESDCKNGLGVCINLIPYTRIVTAFLCEINGKDHLYLQREGMDEELSNELSTAALFPIPHDVEYENESPLRSGVAGTITFIGGNYPIIIQDEYFLIPIKIKYE
ncbi:MAG: hypothetical protein IPJ86_17085 [Bacteroidetes bacterium]|nr:hypothetical protein [Bacteroidota bacterium]